MGIFRKTGKVFKPFVNFPKWMGWDSLVDLTKIVSNTAKSLFTVRSPSKIETFEQARRRYGLSEQDLERKARGFFVMSLFYATIAVMFFGYSVYIYRYTGYGSLVAFLVGVLAAIFSFRENFWWFQIKQRRLGCRIPEWFNKVILRR